MRVMYDAINPENIPKDAKLVASYVDGRWPNYYKLAGLFPNAKRLSIAVFDTSQAMCLDVEGGNPTTPAQSVDWVLNMRSAGITPWIYCNQDIHDTNPYGWGRIRRAFDARNVAQPLYWVANYTTGPVFVDGAVAHQYQGTTAPGFDLSIVLDYIPGFDSPVKPLPTGKVKKIMFLASTSDGKIWLITNNSRKHVLTPSDVKQYQAAGVVTVNLTDQEILTYPDVTGQ